MTARSLVGIPSEGIIKAVATLDECHAGTYWVRVKFAGKERVPNWRDAACIMLVKIKTYWTDRTIASMFGLVDPADDPEGVNGAHKLVARVFRAFLPMYVDMVDKTVARRVEWQDVDRFRHKDFRENGWDIVYQVNDATTYDVQKSTDPMTNHLTYSNYKNKTGFMSNHVMGPDTLPFSVTPTYAARCDDATLMAAPDAGFEDTWIAPRPGIAKAGSMGDKGTKARKMVEAIGGVYFEPPFCSDGMMTAGEVRQSELVAKPRSHVERCIGFTRGHKMLREPLPASYFCLLDDIVKVATFNIHFTPFVKAMRAVPGGDEDAGDGDSDDSDDA